MKLIGSKNCVFRRAIEIFLQDHATQYFLEEEPSQKDYPILYKNDPGKDDAVDSRKMCGIIAILEGLSEELDNNPATAEVEEINNNRATVEEINNNSNNNSIDTTRMWLFTIMNELWYNCAKEILEQRIFRTQNEINSSHQRIKASRVQLSLFLKDMNLWLQERIYLDKNLKYTDILLASILSYLDYLDEIRWNNYPYVKEWYSLIKSRPCFSFILKDRIPGIKPPLHFDLIDF